jgi:predicted enzyme related to lactoylglutathione lyase
MQVTELVLNVTSEDPERLGAFYRDVVQLTPHPVISGHAFVVGQGATFIVDGHSETKGQSQEPHRTLFNFFVEDVTAERKRLEAQGVQFIRKEGREFWGGVISTFVDPDGNYAQIVEFKPSGAAK